MKKNTKAVSLSELYPIIVGQLSKGGSVRFKPHGVSMLPFIRQESDEVTLVSPSGRLKRGDIAFYRRDNGQFVLHRVIKVLPSGYIMRGDHQIEREYGITDKNIIAVTKEVVRSGKVIRSNSLSFFLWGNLGPFSYRTFNLLYRLKKRLFK